LVIDTELLKEEEEIEAATLMRSMACVAAERGEISWLELAYRNFC
jgi:hypothetical protein